MPADLPKNIIKLIIALLKHQAENVLGKDAIGIAGDALVDIGGEKIQGKIDAILNTNEGSQKLIDAALRADSYFREKCTDQDLREAFAMPTGNLPSVQAMLKELPNALDQEDALDTLRNNLTGTFPNLKKEQIEYGANFYLECLNRALLPLEDFTLPIIGRSIIESEAGIKKGNIYLEEIKTNVEKVLQIISPVPVAASEIVSPSPEFDPTLIENMDSPRGALKTNDPFYVERDADSVIKRHIVKNGSTIIIRASHQTGKSSLLARGLNYAGSNIKVARIDLQGFARGVFETGNSFYKHFAREIIRKLAIDPKVLDLTWQEDISPLSKLNELMEDYVLCETNRQLVLAIDEADRLMLAPFRDDFFGLIRVWHNNRPNNDIWNNLNLVLIISTEPSALISSLDQSPFNVGEDIFLEDFSYEQVYRLNKLHGEPVKNNDFDVFFELLSGHPYLTRSALYLLISKRWTFQDLIKNAARDDGPFSDNLRNQFRILLDDKQLRKSYAEIIKQNRCENKNNISRLLQAGLIKGKGETYYCRCGLYKHYFTG